MLINAENGVEINNNNAERRGRGRKKREGGRKRERRHAHLYNIFQFIHTGHDHSPLNSMRIHTYIDNVFFSMKKFID